MVDEGLEQVENKDEVRQKIHRNISFFDRTYGLKIRSTSTKTVSHGELEQYVWAADAARSF